RADNAPATQPTAAAEQGIDPVLQVLRLRAQVESASLPAGLSTRADSIFNAAIERAETLKSDIEDLPPAQRAERVSDFMSDLRHRLSDAMPGRFGQPTTRPAGASGGPFAQIAGRMFNALRQLDLSADQRQQIRNLATSMRQQAADIRRRHQAGENVAGEALGLVAEFRSKLFEILTPQQQEQFRDLMRGSNPAQASGPPPPPLDEPPDPNNPFLASSDSGVSAPPIRIDDIDYGVLDLSKLKNRVVVLEFGSATCPSFRDHVQEMDKLFNRYSNDVTFCIVYTREAHPSDGWDVQRNHDDQVDVRQTTTLLDRREMARKTREYFHIRIPIAVDDMNDSVSKAFNGFPNATVIIGHGGNIVGRQQWTDPSGLPRLIDLAISGG
ncbi:MAG TPA: deiodinase-like protein, partial [Tepidisphaeraceae bacterium]|nr:deiodinase-like protein [Tepidisphaeraceae bacterium]